MQLQGKTALVTGSTSGISLAIARAFAFEGASLMINGFGPAERDQSVGPDGADDGGAIWLAGVTYAKGLGTHARSEIVYDLANRL